MPLSTLLERMVDRIGKVLMPEAAKEILEIRADDETQQRVDALADKCNEGSLSPEEQSQYGEVRLAIQSSISVTSASAIRA